VVTNSQVACGNDVQTQRICDINEPVISEPTDRRLFMLGEVQVRIDLLESMDAPFIIGRLSLSNSGKASCMPRMHDER